MAKIIHFPTPDSDLLLLHIELKEITPKIWRRFQCLQASPWSSCIG